MRTWQTISAVILGQCVTVAAMSAETGTGAKMINDVQPEMVLDRLLTAIAQTRLVGHLGLLQFGPGCGDRPQRVYSVEKLRLRDEAIFQ